MDDSCFQSLFNSCAGCRIVAPVPCGGHPLAPSGHGRSCRLDDECLVKGEKRGSVQGCWQTEHTVNRPGCPLVGETLKHRSRWWVQLLNILVHKWFIQGCKPGLMCLRQRFWCSCSQISGLWFVTGAVGAAQLMNHGKCSHRYKLFMINILKNQYYLVYILFGNTVLASWEQV